MIKNTHLLLVGGMSRSGTTLLSSVFAAHPDIAAGAELIPSPIPSLTTFKSLVETALVEQEDYSLVGRYIRKNGEKVLGGIVTRCYRAGITGEEILAVLDGFLVRPTDEILTPLDRVEFAVSGISKHMERENKSWGSFKLNMPSMKAVLDAYSQTHIAFLVRHPADVMHSQLTKGFSNSAETVGKVWENYIRNALIAKAAHPERFDIVKYEDLAAEPKTTLEKLFVGLPLDMDEKMLRFQEAKTHIFTSRHPNTEQLKKGFVTDAIGGTKKTYSPEITECVSGLNAKYMQMFGYGG